MRQAVKTSNDETLIVVKGDGSACRLQLSRSQLLSGIKGSRPFNLRNAARFRLERDLIRRKIDCRSELRTSGQYEECREEAKARSRGSTQIALI